jgi:hypothetical protein
MPRRGRTFEELTALLEQALRTHPDVRVESPARVTDMVTGQSREIDVLLTIPLAHHTIRIALECRERSRPVGVPEVEAFLSKIQDTGINQGVIVSATGFASTARTKAEKHHIRCLSLNQVSSLEWLNTDHVAVLQRYVHNNDWSIGVAGEPPSLPEAQLMIRFRGTELTPEARLSSALRVLLDSEYDQGIPGRYEKTFELNAADLELVDREAGTAYPVEKADVSVTWEASASNIPLELHTYRRADGTHIAEAATATLGSELGPAVLPGTLLLVRDPERGIRADYLPSTPQAQRKRSRD